MPRIHKSTSHGNDAEDSTPAGNRAILSGPALALPPGLPIPSDLRLGWTLRPLGPDGPAGYAGLPRQDCDREAVPVGNQRVGATVSAVSRGGGATYFSKRLSWLAAVRFWRSSRGSSRQSRRRVNWWQWDQFSSGVRTVDSGGGPVPIPADVRLVFQKLDLLATQMVSFRKWDLMVLGGVTYAGNGIFVKQSSTTATFTQRNRFDGWGLTAGTLAYRDIGWCEGLQGYGGVQWSGVYGNDPGGYTRVAPGDTSTTTFCGESTMLSILELKVGTQYELRIGWGAIGFVSAGFESQYWTPLDSSLGDVGLVGFTVGTGIQR